MFSHLAERLVGQVCPHVTIVDDYGGGRMENLVSIENKISLVEDSVEHYKFPDSGFDVVYHLAAHPWAIN